MSRTDEKIKKDVVDQLNWDSRFDSSNIKVEVKNGEVVLSGFVNTFWIRRIVENDTIIIPGVAKIKNLLTVKYPIGAEIPNDDQIKSSVKTIISWDPNLDQSKIDTSIKNGVVTLEGTVDSFWKKFGAERIISNVRGVLGIINKLSIVRLENVDEETIAKNIEDALSRNLNNAEVNSIDVEVKNGEVILSGTVKNRTTYDIAYNTASHTAGILDVKNDISIAT